MDVSTDKRPVRYGTIVAVVASVLAICSALSAGCGPKADPDDVKEVRRVAEDFLEEAVEPDYEALFELVETSDVPLLSVLTCKFRHQVPSVITNEIEDLRGMLVKDGGIAAAVNWMTKCNRNKLRSAEIADVKPLAEDSYVVILQCGGGASSRCPLVITHDDDGWGWDLSAYLALDGPDATEYIKDYVDFLLEDWRYDKALVALRAIEGLGTKFDLWLKGPMKESTHLADEQVGLLEKGKSEAEGVPVLIEKVEEEKAANP